MTKNLILKKIEKLYFYPKGWVPVNLALGSALNYSIILTTLSIIYLCLIIYKNSFKSPTDYD